MKEHAEEKNTSSSIIKSKGVLITMAILVIVVIIAIIALVASGIFGQKESRLYDGLNELKPGTYICVNNGDDYVEGYISTDGIYEADDNIEIGFRYGNKTSIVVKPSQKVTIWGRDSEVDIVCTRN